MRLNKECKNYDKSKLEVIKVKELMQAFHVVMPERLGHLSIADVEDLISEMNAWWRPLISNFRPMDG